ncbi:MAG: hypothetical protein OXD01_13635 [Gammaproteobacteria bacterium]|nr:hypothetical protein [Gammaproteobacteria bacterium]
MRYVMLFATLSCYLFAWPVWAQQIQLQNQVWSADLVRPSGQPLIPLYDGWFTNPDGTHTLCFSYFTLNTEQSFDLPRGELNEFDERFPEALVPTHFDPLPPAYRHVFCAFSIDVSADFSRNDRIVWRLTSNGQSLEVPGKLLPAYIMDEPASGGRGDIAPLVAVEEGGEAIRGRRGIHQRNLRAKVNEPLELRAWIEHAEPNIWVGWAHHSGNGSVEFDQREYEFEHDSGPATVRVNFSEAGEYVIRMQTIDDIAAFEFYCCHTNAYFYVTVGE